MSERDRIKKWRDGKRKPCPDGCGTEVAYDTIACRSCHAIRKRESSLDSTVSEIKSTSRSLRWTDHVRYFARKMHSFKECEVCGYDKHIEIAHVKPIASFDDNVTIREINAIENVMGLCPNHHWEFDNDQLHPRT